MKKAFVILLCIAILMLSIPATVISASSDTKPVTPADLKSITFIHYAKPDNLPVKPVKPEPTLPTVENDYYELIGTKLPGTVDYYFNPSGAPAGALEEIQDSFNSWDSETSADLFNYIETTTISGMKYDGQNTVSWNKIAPRSAIAVTRLWYDSNYIVQEFDIVFNSFLKWGIDTDDEGTADSINVFDVENISTHEVGHVVGLKDLYEDQYRELTMYGYGSLGETQKISLEEGDILGTQEIYGY